MDRWDVIIIIAAGYIAIVSLVRLMAKRRDELVEQVREQLAKRRGRSPKRAEPGDQNAN